MKKSMMLLCCVWIFSGVLFADWDPGQPAKWVQLPDLTPEGMDVYASNQLVLADDFLCTSTERITDVHIWGSWYQDILPINPDGTGDPGAVEFRLSIHADIPATPTSYSRPGELLWEWRFLPGEFQTRPYAMGIEGWYDPAEGFYTPEGDQVAWQYNFFIDPAVAFEQKGTPDQPIVYWLDVQAFPLNAAGTPEAMFGWKTSMDHWNDDAVWAFDPGTTIPDWQELRYPSSHPFGGESIDLAFVITPEPTSLLLLGLGGLALRRRR